jgi:hypothetical protein
VGEWKRERGAEIRRGNRGEREEREADLKYRDREVKTKR